MELDTSYISGDCISSWSFWSNRPYDNRDQVIDLICNLIKIFRDSDLILLPEMSSFIKHKFEQVYIKDISERLYIDEVVINGEGREYTSIEGARGSYRTSTALLASRINFFNLSRVRITIETRSDIWMPYTLVGDPNTSAYLANMNRLSKLLNKVAELGFDLREDNYREEKYCIISGFMMQNYPHRIVELGYLGDEVQWEEVLSQKDIEAIRKFTITDVQI